MGRINLATIIGAVGVSVAVVASAAACSSDPTQPRVSHTVDVDFAFDITDPALVAGFATNVWVGTVIKQVGRHSASSLPATQFQVRVIGNIKGDLSGDVIVNQEAGYDDDGFLSATGETLVEAGKTYVFAGRGGRYENWYTAVPVTGHTLVPDQEVSAWRSGGDSVVIDQWEKYVRAEKDPGVGVASVPLQPAPPLRTDRPMSPGPAPGLSASRNP